MQSHSIVQVVTDFFDEMKSRSKGYASMEYQITGYRENNLVRLDVKVNQEVCTGPFLLTCHFSPLKLSEVPLMLRAILASLTSNNLSEAKRACSSSPEGYHVSRRWQSPWHQSCTGTRHTRLAGSWCPS